MTKKGTFSRGTNVRNPERAARVANQNAVFKICSRIQSSNLRAVTSFRTLCAWFHKTSHYNSYYTLCKSRMRNYKIV